MSSPIRFGSYELNPAAGELRKGGVRVLLSGQPLEVLALLVKRPGEVVAREELKEALWPDETFVDFDNGLNSAVRRIRRTLDDSATEPQFKRFDAESGSLTDVVEMHRAPTLPRGRPRRELSTLRRRRLQPTGSDAHRGHRIVRIVKRIVTVRKLARERSVSYTVNPVTPSGRGLRDFAGRLLCGSLTVTVLLRVTKEGNQ